MTFARQRPMPPELWTVEKFMLLEPAVKWTAVGLRMFADDHGRETRTDWILRRALYPRDEVSAEEFDSHLLALAEAGAILLYEVNGAEVYQITDWPAVSHAKRSLFPPPPEDRRRTAGDSPEGLRVEEREGERGSGASEPESEASSGPPSNFCPRHRPNGVNHPCRDCGTARLAVDEYWRTHGGRPSSEESDQDG